MRAGAHPALAQGKVRYVGDHVCVIDRRDAGPGASDASEAILVDYEVLPAVVDPPPARPARRRRDPCGSARQHGRSNWHLGDKDETEAGVQGGQARHQARHRRTTGSCRMRWSRARPSATMMTARASSPSIPPARTRMWRSAGDGAFLGIAPENKLRVIAPDVGGGFGSKIFIYAEETICVWAARKVGRPVKWTSDRTEAFLSDAHGRDHVTKAEPGAGRGRQDHRPARLTPRPISAPISRPSRRRCRPISTHRCCPGSVRHSGDLLQRSRRSTPTPLPVDAYRGAGRPEATFVIERLMEVAARQLGKDPAKFRAQNFVKKFPHQTPVIMMQYDAGDYESVAEGRPWRMADYKGLGKRKRDSARNGKLRGIGFSILHRSLRHRALGGGRLARRWRRLYGNRHEVGSIRSARSRS